MPYVQRHTDIRIQAERAWLDALLSHAPDVRGLIVIAVPYLTRLRESRENAAAAALRNKGFGTLIVSMLTPYEESRDPDVRYDVSLLHHRLQALITWIDQQPGLSGLPMGMLGVDTVVSACVRQVVREPGRVSALVSRSGRADLAGAEPLRKLNVPFLMLVPGSDAPLLRPAEQAFALIGAPKVWRPFEGVSSGFIEPGALEESAQAACDWFEAHLPQPPGADDTSLP